jgi:hypothetical protein
MFKMLANYIGNWPCSADHPAELAEISEFIIFVLWNESWAISPPFNLCGEIDPQRSTH